MNIPIFTRDTLIPASLAACRIAAYGINRTTKIRIAHDICMIIVTKTKITVRTGIPVHLDRLMQELTYSEADVPEPAR
jgi:hypothetical protein